MNLDPLYSISSNGKQKVWSIKVIDCKLHITFGYEDGKMQTSIRSVEVKNLGKSNETTLQAQAENEALSRWKRKQKQGYLPSSGQTNSQFSSLGSWAMTALDYTKRSADILFPCFVQPKLDGVRALFKGGKFYTRSGDLRDFCGELELEAGLIAQKFNMPLDGELYSPKLSFEKLTGLTNKNKLNKDESQDLQFYVFDCICSESFERRANILKEMFLGKHQTRVFMVETEICLSGAAVKPLLEKYLDLGFEGIMLRNCEGMYKSGYRSKDLQKYKLFADEEFQIVGYKRGKGKARDCVIWQCQTVEGKKFWVKPSCTFEEGAAYLKEAEKYIGLNLTVKYQEKTKNGVPRFPVGKCIRSTAF